MTREEAELLSKKYVVESDIAMREYRHAIIEQCARVAETWYENHHPVHCDEIAAAIRALKDR